MNFFRFLGRHFLNLSGAKKALNWSRWKLIIIYIFITRLYIVGSPEKLVDWGKKRTNGWKVQEFVFFIEVK